MSYGYSYRAFQLTQGYPCGSRYSIKDSSVKRRRIIRLAPQLPTLIDVASLFD